MGIWVYQGRIKWRVIRETQGNDGRGQKRECSMNGVDDTTRDAVIRIHQTSRNRK